MGDRSFPTMGTRECLAQEEKGHPYVHLKYQEAKALTVEMTRLASCM